MICLTQKNEPPFLHRNMFSWFTCPLLISPSSFHSIPSIQQAMRNQRASASVFLCWIKRINAVISAIHHASLHRMRIYFQRRYLFIRYMRPLNTHNSERERQTNLRGIYKVGDNSKYPSCKKNQSPQCVDIAAAKPRPLSRYVLIK